MDLCWKIRGQNCRTEYSNVLEGGGVNCHCNIAAGDCMALQKKKSQRNSIEFARAFVD